jgi:hypothetical protein
VIYNGEFKNDIQVNNIKEIEDDNKWYLLKIS